MRIGLLLPLAGLVVVAGVVRAQPAAPDSAALRKKLAELEERVAALQRDAAELRKQLDGPAPAKPAILTPQEAVEAFKRNPDQPVTVEFGVVEGTGAIYTGIGPDPLTFITAVWDQRLQGGGQFKAIISERAFTGLTIPAREKGKPAFKPAPAEARTAVARHIDAHGVRVTGRLRKAGDTPFAESYFIEVDDPAKVPLFLSVAPRPLWQR